MMKIRVLCLLILCFLYSCISSNHIVDHHETADESILNENSNPFPPPQDMHSPEDKKYSVFMGYDRDSHLCSISHCFFADSWGRILVPAPFIKGMDTCAISPQLEQINNPDPCGKVIYKDESFGLAVIQFELKNQELPENIPNNIISEALANNEPEIGENLFIYGDPSLINYFRIAAGTDRKSENFVTVKVTESELRNGTHKRYGFQYDLNAWDSFPAALSGAPVYNKNKKITGILMFEFIDKKPVLSIVPSGEITAFLRNYPDEQNNINESATTASLESIYSAATINSQMLIPPINFNMTDKFPLIGDILHINVKFSFAGRVQFGALNTVDKIVNFRVMEILDEKSASYSHKDPEKLVLLETIPDSNGNIPDIMNHVPVFNPDNKLIGITRSDSKYYKPKKLMVPNSFLFVMLNQYYADKYLCDSVKPPYELTSFFNSFYLPKTIVSSYDQNRFIEVLFMLHPQLWEVHLIKALIDFRKTEGSMLTENHLSAVLRAVEEKDTKQETWLKNNEMKWIHEHFIAVFKDALEIDPEKTFRYYTMLSHGVLPKNSDKGFVNYGLKPAYYGHSYKSVYTRVYIDYLSLCLEYNISNGPSVVAKTILDSEKENPDLLMELASEFYRNKLPDLGYSLLSAVPINDKNRAQVFSILNSTGRNEFYINKTKYKLIGKHLYYPDVPVQFFKQKNGLPLVLSRQNQILYQNLSGQDRGIIRLQEKEELAVITCSPLLMDSELKITENNWKQHIESKYLNYLLYVQRTNGEHGWIPGTSVFTNWYIINDQFIGITQCFFRMFFEYGITDGILSYFTLKYSDKGNEAEIALLWENEKSYSHYYYKLWPKTFSIQKAPNILQIEGDLITGGEVFVASGSPAILDELGKESALAKFEISRNNLKLLHPENFK